MTNPQKEPKKIEQFYGCPRFIWDLMGVRDLSPCSSESGCPEFVRTKMGVQSYPVSRALAERVGVRDYRDY
jgi:hypothetical protein